MTPSRFFPRHTIYPETWRPCFQCDQQRSGEKLIRGYLSSGHKTQGPLCPVSTLPGVSTQCLGPLRPLGRGPCRANPPSGRRQEGLGGACTYLKDLRAFHQPPGSPAPENKGQQPPGTRWLTVQQEAQRGAGPCLRSHSPQSLRGRGACYAEERACGGGLG